MLIHESERFFNSVLVQHVTLQKKGLHVCKNCNGPEILERAVQLNINYNKIQSYPP